MEKITTGKVYVLGDDIDTDQIIPAKYLSYNPAIAEERQYFGKYALDGLPEGQAGLPAGNKRFVEDMEGFTSPYKVIVAGNNFGCGSSREHAPLAIAEAGSTVVVANTFARIFFRNCVNGGYLVPYETPIDLTEKFVTGDEVEVNSELDLIKNITQGTEYKLSPLGDVKQIIEAGDVFEYAKLAGI